MDESLLRIVAKQLRKPEGEHGKEIGSQMNVGNKFMNVWTIEELNASPGDNILEIGMGNGLFVEKILTVDNSIKYSAIDYSELMIEEAARLNERYVKNGQAKFTLATADKLPYDNEIFNKAFAVNVIYFWENPANELSEIKRVLKPGAKFFVTIRPKYIMDKMPWLQYGFTKYSKEELINLLANHGFKNIKMIEKQEPEQEIMGEIIQLETLIACAQK